VHHLGLLGHLPMALHKDPQRVLVVGLGMGTTYRAVLRHQPRVLRVVEIEEAVVEAAARLDVRPHDIVIADARSYLKATDERFDVITADPIHPWVRGGGDLYTREFLETVRDRLAPGGVACQWCPVHQMGLRDVQEVIATFAAVFRTTAFFGGGDLVLVGSSGESGELDEPGEPRALTAIDLARFGVRRLGALRVAGHEALVAATSGATILTDDALRLEFSTPRQVANPELARCFSWIATLWGDPPRPFGKCFDAQRAWAAGDWPLARQRLDEAYKQAPRNRYVNRLIGEVYLILGGEDVRAGHFDLADNALKWAERFLPGDPRVRGARAEYWHGKGDTQQAAALFRALLEETPGSVFLARKLAQLE